LTFPHPRQAGRQTDTPLLSVALADATLATLDLARSTSAPAARLGLEALEAAAQQSDQAEPESAGDAGSGLAPFPLVLRDLSQSSPDLAWLQEVGDDLAARVRPLSSSARQAFGFLRAPELRKTETSSNSPASKGA
jgi:hypothetical protein